MSPYRIALANLLYPTTPEESVTKAEQAIAQAAREHAEIICFPECFIPGYRGMGKSPPPPGAKSLERAWSAVAAAAARLAEKGFGAGEQDGASGFFCVAFEPGCSACCFDV